MSSIQERRVERDPVRLVEPDHMCRDAVKIFGLAMTALALHGVVNSLDSRQACVDWNDKMNLEEDVYSKELDKAVEIEKTRNKHADAAYEAVQAANEAVQKEREKDWNVFNCNINDLTLPCKEEKLAFFEASMKALKAEDLFWASDKRYQETLRHISDLNKKVDYIKERKPFACSRKYR